MELKTETITEIKSYVLSQYPKESCGVIVEGNFLSMENVSDTPEVTFKIRDLDYGKVVDRVEAIIHSHCVSPDHIRRFDIRTPSLEDRLSQRRSNKPWGIVGTEGENVTDILWYPHIPNNNYIGRIFIPYVNDCFTIVQDYIQFELGKTPPAYVIDYEWTNNVTFSKILERFLSYPGFEEVTKISKLRNGDLLILNHELGEISHFGVYDNGMILHQSQRSCRVPFSHFEGNIVKMLRFVGEENEG
jgi:proteasome lid subunit RPN8/RPN11